MKLYHINQSPLYKLKTHNNLVKYLGIDTKILVKLLKRRHKNFYEAEITQKNGELRAIQVPKPQLMRLHKRIQKLFSRIQKPDYLYSGVKTRSNVRNAEQHIGNSYVYKVDIQSFYKSTDIERIKKCFMNIFEMAPDVAETMSRLCTINDHLPTGSPISQSLSFFTNVRLFNEINRYCSSRQITFTTYVDDLTFSSNNPNILRAPFKKQIALFFKKGSSYILHKHRGYGLSAYKPITGAILHNNKLFVPNSQRDKIKKAIDRQAYMLSIHHTQKEKVEKYFQSLVGSLYSAAQISPHYKLKAIKVLSTRREHEIKAINKKRTKH